MVWRESRRPMNSRFFVNCVHKIQQPNNTFLALCWRYQIFFGQPKSLLGFWQAGKAVVADKTVTSLKCSISSETRETVMLCIYFWKLIEFLSVLLDHFSWICVYIGDYTSTVVAIVRQTPEICLGQALKSYMSNCKLFSL